jgi:hypothetical protein
MLPLLQASLPGLIRLVLLLLISATCNVAGAQNSATHLSLGFLLTWVLNRPAPNTRRWWTI